MTDATLGDDMGMNDMQILAALFIDEIDLREVDGPSTRIDLGGVQFSGVAPSRGTFTWAPHLVVIVRAPKEHGVLETVFTIGDNQVARNVQPLQVDPGKFSYRLVRAEIATLAPVTIEATVRLDDGPSLMVPYTLMLPSDEQSPADDDTPFEKP